MPYIQFVSNETNLSYFKIRIIVIIQLVNVTRVLYGYHAHFMCLFSQGATLEPEVCLSVSLPANYWGGLCFKQVADGGLWFSIDQAYYGHFCVHCSCSCFRLEIIFTIGFYKLYIFLYSPF